MRCFLAVETTDETRRLLDRLQRRLAGIIRDIRWARAEQLHLTLEFLGEVTDGFPAAAAGPLATACAGHPAFPARLAGLGAFPDPRRARVLWVGIGQGRAELIRLQRSVAAAVAAIGHQPERRPYSPHLTLGRLRRAADATPAVTAKTTLPLLEQLAALEIPVQRVILIRSELRSDGPHYTEIAAFPLAE
ncbi:MAG: RNA 2',3'-cyclic phosphodiesterase [bacterium]